MLKKTIFAIFIVSFIMFSCAKTLYAQQSVYFDWNRGLNNYQYYSYSPYSSYSYSSSPYYFSHNRNRYSGYQYYRVNDNYNRNNRCRRKCRKAFKKHYKKMHRRNCRNGQRYFPVNY